MAYLDTKTEGNLKAIYTAFASFGSSQTCVEMEGKNFIKLCKDTKLLSKALTTTDLDIIYTKAKAKGARKITWTEFLKALDLVAEKKGCSFDEVVNHVVGHGSGGPQDSGTKAEAVKWHDDKSTYTGVYAKGGPNNIDMDPTNLAGLCDRTAADKRGVKLSGPAAANNTNRRSTGGSGKIPAAGNVAGRRTTADTK
eukprot:GHRR01021876.1.p1 GENE.GHRR01021876.1~~GHRR01021876.1.p1  ORF type:complete len:196 (+),score=54.06 GHRR01021876.1:2350-2937(+)